MKEYNYDLFLKGKLKLSNEVDPGVYYENKRILAQWILEKLEDPNNTPEDIKKLNYSLELARYTGD